MNIFFLDKDPAWAVRFHVDRHVAGQIRETAQILQSAHIMTDGRPTAVARLGNTIIPVAHGYMNHPVVRWVRKSSANYDWTAQLFAQLILEFNLRNHKAHLYECLVDLLKRRPLQIPMGELTEFPQDTLAGRFVNADPVAAHRRYYFEEKAHLATWTMPARTPQWWKDMQLSHELQRRDLSGAIRG